MGGNDANVTAPSARQALPTVLPMPSVGWVDMVAQGVPLEVVEQLAMAVILLPSTGQTGLPAMLVVPTTVGMTQPVVTLIA